MFKVRSAADKVKTEIGAYGFGDRVYRGRDRGLCKMDRGLCGIGGSDKTQGPMHRGLCESDRGLLTGVYRKRNRVYR